MQIRLSRDLEGRVCVAPGPITVEEFLARFPEVPRDLREEPRRLDVDLVDALAGRERDRVRHHELAQR